MKATTMEPKHFVEQITPAFLMCPPLHLSADEPNNIWMREMSAAERVVNRPLALQQFLKLYRHLAERAMVYLLPSQPGLQDLVYVANLGVVLPHTPERTIVLANFRSEPRRGETEAGRAFFERFEQPCVIGPAYFEGEADLKHLKGNVYVGAHGMRTSLDALQWFEREFEMEVIPFRITNEHLYHLDCVVFPLTREQVLLCTELTDRETIARIEKYMEIVDVSFSAARAGIANCLRIGDQILCSTHINTMSEGHPELPDERKKLAELERICARLGLQPVYFELTEFLKSGALLSCMVMHLNYCNF